MEPNNISPVETNPYDFILNNKPVNKPLIDFNDKKSVTLAGLALIIVIIISLIIIKSIFSGPTIIDISSYTKVLQDQQEIIHLTTEVDNNTFGNLNLSNSLANATITTNLSIISQQNQTQSYLKLNGYSVSPSLINAGINLALDTKLTADYQNTTFYSDYQNALDANLTTYLNDLSSDYKLSTGKHGRIMLQSDYNSTLLLIKMLNS